jgi:hypothetical protein
MRFLSRTVPSAALLVLVLNTQLSWVITFSPSLPGSLPSVFGGRINNRHGTDRPRHLFMAGSNDGFFDGHFMSADQARQNLTPDKQVKPNTPKPPVAETRVEEPEPVVKSDESEPSEDKMAQVRTVYLQWCEVYGKEVNEERFHIFSSNFLSMKAYADKTDEPLQFHKWFDCTEEEYIALTAGGTAAEINTETKSEEEIRGATTSVDILDAAGAAKDAKEWAEVQARFSAEANARLKKVAGKSCENLLLFYTKSNEILISVCTRRRSRGKAKSCACRKIPNGCFRN